MTTKLLTILLEWLYSFGEGIMNLASKLLLTLNNSGAGQTPAEAYAAKVLTYNPLVYWKLNESSGTTVTNYGSLAGADAAHNNANIAGQTTGPDGSSPAPLYVIANSYVTDLYSAALGGAYDQDNISLSFWFRYDGDWSTFTAAEYFARIQKDSSNNFNVWKIGINTMQIQFRGTGTTVNHAINMVTAGANDGNWHHFLIVFDTVSNVSTVYIDGTSRSTGASPAYTGGSLNSNLTLLAGNALSPPAAELDGSIAEVAVIESVLDVDDATALATYGA